MRFFVILSCFVALAAAAPQGYYYGLPRFSGDASLIGAGSGAHLSALGASGSASSLSSGSQFGQQFGGHPQFRQYTPEIQKHIYVHVPPPDHEILPAPRVVHFDQPRKHYKIIFIKAPSPPEYQAPVLPVPHQDEEKTIVYLLVKKPDHQPDIHVPTPAPTVPAKPEVYFIKYNTNKDIGQDIRSQALPHTGAGTSFNPAHSGSGSSLAPAHAGLGPLNHLGATSSNTGAAFTGSGISSGSSQLSASNFGGSASSGSHVTTPHTQYGVPL